MKLRTIVGLLLIAGLAWTLQAETLKLTGVSGESSSGEQIGPYFVTVDGVTKMVACDDLFIGIGMGHTWEADKLGWSDLLTQERPVYGAAYWLVTDILNPATTPHADEQFALWRLFSPSAPLPGGAPTSLAWATGQYAGNPTYAGYQELVIYRPNPRQSSQEMLALNPTETPELLTLSYVMSGLGLLVVSRLRRKKTA